MLRRFAPVLALALLASCSSGSGDGGGETGSTDSTATAPTDGDDGESESETGDACGGRDPLPPQPCDKMCVWPCGCDECEPHGVICVDRDDGEEMMQQCGGDGTCADNIPCAEGRTCMSLSSTEGRCSETLDCDQTQAIYDVTIAKTSCANDEQCTVLQGQCASGLGDCWHAVNPQVTQELLDELGMQWADEGCGADSCGGDCVAAPAAKCVDNACVLE